jgi:hypothetical protein
MDSHQFDRLARSFSRLLSRRSFASLVGFRALLLSGQSQAKKKHKRKKKKVKRNDFGCVDVGKFCKNDGQCCSGICQGKKDKKTCKAHDESTCQTGQSISECGGTDVPCTTSTGDTDGLCFTTTGKAGYCYRTGNCFVCNKDADCTAVCGPQAACIVCAGCSREVGTDTGCVGPSADSCDFGPPAP